MNSLYLFLANYDNQLIDRQINLTFLARLKILAEKTGSTMICPEINHLKPVSCVEYQAGIHYIGTSLYEINYYHVLTD